MSKTIAGLALALVVAVQPAAAAKTILFIGNSFTYGEPAGAAAPTVQAYQPGTVTDLNGTGVGGVPALFKQFTVELGLDYSVSLETVGGTGLDYHYNNKLALIDRPWDQVVMQGYSTLDAAKPGDATKLTTYAGLLAQALHDENPDVDIRLTATWSRADLTYKTQSPWFGKPIDAMEKDVEAGNRQAAAASSDIVDAVIPVGAAWNDAIVAGLADANPYDGIDPGKIDLWAPEGYHASVYGYYLSALTQFGAITGRDPRDLGAGETAALALGIAAPTAVRLQQVAYQSLRTSVPEPATWAMLAAGFGTVGVALRRRPAAAAARP